MTDVRWLTLPAVLALAVTGTAALTARLPAPTAPPPSATPDPTPVEVAPVRLGAATPGGVVAYRPGADGALRATAVDSTGRARWERVLPPGHPLPVCGPCPAAWLVDDDGLVTGVDVDGRPVPGPPPVNAPVRVLGLGQPVLLTGGPDPTPVWTATIDGPTALGPLDAVDVDDPRVQAAAAVDGSAVTFVGPHPDPLRLAEARVTHLTGSTRHDTDVAVPDAGSRVFPCTADDPGRWGVLVAGLGGDGSAPHATLIVHGAGPPERVALPTFFDGCALGPDGALLWTVAIGADGGAGAQLDTARITHGVVTASTHRFTRPPSVAADAPRARLAAVTPDQSIELTASGPTTLPPAVAATYDALGGLWLATADPLKVSRRP